jgi:hypothetical protein
MPKLGSFGTGSLRPSGFQGVPRRLVTGQNVYTTPGTYTGTNGWLCPTYVTRVNIALMGGGGGGGGAGRNGSGAGGGAITYVNDVPVNPGTRYSFQVGAGGSVNSDGGASWFNTSTYLYANGGKAGTTVATNATGEAVFAISTYSTDSRGISGPTPVVTTNSSLYSNRPISTSGGAIGSYSYHNWTCPEGVWTVSVVCIGGGGGRAPALADAGGASGAGNVSNFQLKTLFQMYDLNRGSQSIPQLQYADIWYYSPLFAGVVVGMFA